MTREKSKWVPFVLKEATEEEKEQQGCEWVCDCPLPDHNTEVLITLHYKDHKGEDRYYVDVDTFCCDDGCYFDDGHEIGTEAIAWMSLPEPYKPEKEVER